MELMAKPAGIFRKFGKRLTILPYISLLIYLGKIWYYQVLIIVCMKRSVITFFLILSSIVAIAQTKRALIVAIGDYLKWPAISSLNDTSYILNALRRQEFDEKNIAILTDSAATVPGITKALNDLIAASKADDIVVIHFSSHGEQIEDNDNDEADGLDETIVTYGAVPPDGNRQFEDFEHAQLDYFRDDQFGVLINRLRAKLGTNGDVIVFMDLCHSGTGTRGNAVVRGGKPPLVSKTFDFNKYARKKDSSEIFSQRSSAQQRGQGSNGLATYVVFEAAGPGELDHETKDENNNLSVGPLSYCVSKVFEKLDSGVTYRSLFSKIAALMNEKAPNQHPALEGTGYDRLLFGGRFIHQKPYVEIEELQGSTIKLKAGLLAGLDTGAKVSVYPSGTIDTSRARPLAEGTVINADTYAATVSLNKDPGIAQAHLAWVFVTEPVYRMEPVGIKIASFSGAEATAIKESLKDFPLIRFDGNPELIITKGISTDSIKVMSNGYVFQTVKIRPDNNDLKEKLQSYAQYKFLQGLDLGAEDIDVEVKLVPVINGKADTSSINTKIINGIYQYNVGDVLTLLINNKGSDPVFFNVLDLQPDGIIKSLLPRKELGFLPEHLTVPGGTSKLLNYKIKIGPPLGNEVFKIFVSRTMIDLEGLGTRGNSRGNLSAVERLVQNSYGTAMRGGDHVREGDSKTYNLLFIIK